VQILHHEEVQTLHSIDGHFLHSGVLKANNSLWPGCKIFSLARLQNIPSGQYAKIAFWQECNDCLQAKVKILHSGIGINCVTLVTLA